MVSVIDSIDDLSEEDLAALFSSRWLAAFLVDYLREVEPD